jgi:hypothetical protein
MAVEQSRPKAQSAQLQGAPRARIKFRTWLGWGLIALPWLILAYEAGRLAPVYYNYVKVARSLDEVAASFHDGDDPESLARGVAEHFRKEGVQYPQVKDIGVSKDGSQWLLEARYDDQATILFNVAVVVSFDKLVHAPSKAAAAP